MSTGADCRFAEVRPGEWKYAIQRWPYGEWDEYDTHGPFPSFAKAREHLDQHYANPGGWLMNIHETDHRHEFHYDKWDDVTVCEPCGATK